MRILAFDLGRNTGAALTDDAEHRTAAFTATGDGDAVFVDWAEWLRRLIEAEQPEVVAYEDVQFNRGRSYIPGMTALLTVVAHEFGLTCFGA